MIYKPRSHTHARKHRLNWSSTIEFIIGILAWVFLCGIMSWAILKSLELYTK